MWHPRVARVGVVLDEHQPTARPKVAPDQPEHGELVALEMERVRHDTVERRQVERSREVSDDGRDLGEREPVAERLHLDPQGATVPIDRVDAAIRSKQVREGEGERPFARSEVRPGRPAVADAPSEQSDVIVVVHAVSVASMGWPYL